MTDKRHELQQIFDICIDQVSDGKGNERHGNGKPFYTQPWVSLAEDFGAGFLYGQGAKKLREAQNFKGERKRQELAVAINYIAMGMLFDLATEPEESTDGE